MAVPLDLDIHFIENAEEILSESRRGCPVRRVTSRYGDNAWIVSRYADVLALLSDPRLIQDPRTAERLGHVDEVPTDEPAAQLMINNMLYRDHPAHTRLRRAVSSAFTPGAVERLRSEIERFVAERLEEMAESGKVDLVSALCEPVPLFVMCEMLGIPEADRAQFTEWAHDLNNIVSVDSWRAAVHNSAEYIRELIASKRAKPTADILSELVSSAAHGEGLTEQELISTALLLIFAGSDTSVGFLANSVVALLSAPDQRKAICENPDLAATAIDELLRFGSPVNIPAVRYASEPITVAGTTIPTGAQVLLSLLSANHDESRFADAGRLDLARRSTGHVAFGRGIHYCVGAPLARLQASVTLAMLFDRFPAMRLAADPAELRRRDSLLINTVTELPVYLLSD